MDEQQFGMCPKLDGVSQELSSNRHRGVRSYQSCLFFRRNQKTGFGGGVAPAFVKLRETRNVLRSWATYCGPVLFLCRVPTSAPVQEPCGVVGDKGSLWEDEGPFWGLLRSWALNPL